MAVEGAQNWPGSGGSMLGEGHSLGEERCEREWGQVILKGGGKQSSRL